MIPKILHYCWFGETPLPKEYEDFVNRWIELHPGWQIIKWDENNSPLAEYPYLKNALANECWANMSNFLRLYGLFQWGGIYLDTDMLLVKSLDELLSEECFFGFEEGEDGSASYWVNNAICGSQKEHRFIGECIKYILEKFDGTEQANLSAPQLITDLLVRRKGLKKYGLQRIDGITLYPKEYFYPIHYTEIFKLSNINEYIYPETISVHTWGRTWLGKEILLTINDDLHKKISGLVNQVVHSEKGSECYGENAISINYPAELFYKDSVFRSITDYHVTELKRLRTTIKEKDETLQKLQESLHEQSIAYNSVNEELELARIQKSTINEELNFYKQQVQRQFESLNTGLGKMAEQIAVLYKENKRLLQEKQDFSNAVSEQALKLAENNHELNELKLSLKSKDSELLQLNSTLSERVVKANNDLKFIEDRKKEILELKKSIAWYQATFEKRRLAGIIKDRCLRYLKLRPTLPDLRSIFPRRDSKDVIQPYDTANFVYNLPRNNNYKEKILCVIGNHNNNENAKKLKSSFSKHFKTIAIDSGSKVKEPDFVNLPNVFYSGLYNHAYNFAREGKFEYLLFVCSDVVVPDAEIDKMANNLAELNIEQVGVYSPASEGRSHYQCKKSASKGLRVVEFVEGFIFLASMKVLNEFSPLDTNQNLYGWGIDVAKGFYSRKLNLLCVVDDEVSVYHPEETGYSSEAAEQQMSRWFLTLPQGPLLNQFHWDRVDLVRSDKRDNMKISVIIPCYNQGRYLLETIYSVFNQTYSNFEIIIVNDGSTDNTEEIANSLVNRFNQIKYVKQENRGLSAARNTGLDLASGNFIQFLDADDLLSMNKFSKTIKAFVGHTEPDIVYSSYICFEDGNKNNTWTYSRVELKEDALLDFITEWEKDLSIPIHCFLYRKEIIGNARFNTSLPNHEDWAFHLDIASRKPVYLYTPEEISYYRIKENAMSQDKKLMRRGKNLCIAKAINTMNINFNYAKRLSERFDFSLVIGIVTCKKNTDKIEHLRKTWISELKKMGIQYYFIIGDPTAATTYVDGDYLYVNCPDNYESLPKKLILFYEYIVSHTSFDYVFKVDDDCYVNVENLYSTSFWEYDYFGRIVATSQDDLIRTWHYGKCQNKELNETPYPGEYIGSWCGGGFGYFLSRKSLEALQLSKDAVMNELYEDKAIGDALRKRGILPEENPNYRTLNIHQFNINHHDELEFTDLADHLRGGVKEYEIIAELQKGFQFLTIHEKKKQLNTIFANNY